jgi:hypothetical protein
MAFQFKNRLDAATECHMRDFFNTLSEKHKRRFVALEARQLGHGGIEYIANVLGCSRRTIERGQRELDDLANDPAEGRTRRSGGGRKKRLLQTLT